MMWTIAFWLIINIWLAVLAHKSDSTWMFVVFTLVNIIGWVMSFAR
jgi:hypothetical protein